MVNGGIREMARIEEYANMGLRGEIGMLTVKNRPHKCPNGPGTVKNDIGGSLEAQTGRNGGQKLRNSRKIAKNGRKTTNLANDANRDGEVARAFPDLL